MDASLETQAQVQSLVSCVMKLVTLCNSLLDQRLNPKNGNGNGIEAFESNLSLAMARKSLGENSRTIASLMNENDVLSIDVARAKEQIDSLQRDNKALSDELRGLYKTQEASYKQIEDLRQERDAAQSSARSASQGWSAAESAVSQLTRDLAELQGKNTKLELELQTSLTSRSSLIAQVESMMGQISERERIIAALRKEVQELEKDAVQAIEEASIPPLIRGLDKAILNAHDPNEKTTA